MGAPAVAAWVAKIAFVCLVTAGVVCGELRQRKAAVFVALGFWVWVGLPGIPRGGDFATPAFALLDIALVLIVYKGDVRLT